MGVFKDESGRRSVQVEVVVPGTPEQVWSAIATGPGISSWFVPSEVEGKVGGSTTSNFGPGMEAEATITAWEPPYRFSADSQDTPDAPKVATEWIVEAQSGDTCVVRVVHRWFAETDDWDSQFEGHKEGWKAFFRILRLYLEHFQGLPSAPAQLMAFAPEPKDAAWRGLIEPLGLAGLSEGQTVKTPQLQGVVERVGVPEYPEELLLRLESPAPGIMHAFAMDMGGQVCLSVRFFFYGDRAKEVAANVEATFPMPS